MSARHVLVRHTGVGEESAREEVAAGHPDIPPATVLEAMRPHLQDDATPPGRPLMWWHRRGDPWGGVIDLHKQGQHADAVMLARLLVWCDSFGRDAVRVWELRPIQVGPSDPTLFEVAR